MSIYGEVMETNLPLIRVLATTLLSELDSLNKEVEEEPFDLHEKVRELEIKLIRTALTKTGGKQPVYWELK